MEDHKIYGERLKNQRILLGLTQADIIEKLKIGKSTIISWEQGSTFPTLVHISEFEKIGFDVNYLLTGKIKKALDIDPCDAPEKFSYIPVYPNEVCAGDGLDAFDSEPLYHHAFRDEWLNTREYNAKKLAIIRIKGDSMIPVLQNGDYVLINTASHIPKTGCIFVVRIGTELLAKYIEIQFDGSINLKCRNDFYDDMVISPEQAELDGFSVVGEIVQGSREYLN